MFALWGYHHYSYVVLEPVSLTFTVVFLTFLLKACDMFESKGGRSSW